MTRTCRTCRRRRRPWALGDCRTCWANHPRTQPFDPAAPVRRALAAGLTAQQVADATTWPSSAVRAISERTTRNA